MHCPNTGAMTGCAEPGSEVWYSTSANPKRKYAHTLEVVVTALGPVAVHSAVANGLVAEGLRAGALAELAGYREHRSEVAVPDGKGRFDFRLTEPARPDCYVE